MCLPWNEQRTPVCAQTQGRRIRCQGRRPPTATAHQLDEKRFDRRGCNQKGTESTSPKYNIYYIKSYFYKSDESRRFTLLIRAHLSAWIALLNTFSTSAHSWPHCVPQYGEWLFPGKTTCARHCRDMQAGATVCSHTFCLATQGDAQQPITFCTTTSN